MHSKILCVPYITVYFYILCIVILLAQLIACVLLFNFVNLFHSLLVSHRALSLFSLLIKDLLVCDLSLFNEATAELTLFKIFHIIKRIIYFKVLGTNKKIHGGD